jgi:protein phosphatase
MAELVVTVGSRSSQGRRPNNEDRYVADPSSRLFLVADGMGGQDSGERASELASEIIPRILKDKLASCEKADKAVQEALDQANQLIIHEGQTQAPGRRMGTTAVLAVQQDNLVYVAGLGDSRAYLVRNGRVDQLTMDHTVADALERNGALTHEQAAVSPWKHVLYKFLGCVEMNEGAEVRPFMPEAGDRLVLATDGLTNHVTTADLLAGVARGVHPQSWADQLVQSAIERGSSDNVTCVVVAFDYEAQDSKVLRKLPSLNQ